MTSEQLEEKEFYPKTIERNDIDDIIQEIEDIKNSYSNFSHFELLITIDDKEEWVVKTKILECLENMDWHPYQFDNDYAHFICPNNIDFSDIVCLFSFGKIDNKKRFIELCDYVICFLFILNKVTNKILSYCKIENFDIKKSEKTTLY